MGSITCPSILIMQVNNLFKKVSLYSQHITDNTNNQLKQNMQAHFQS